MVCGGVGSYTWAVLDVGLYRVWMWQVEAVVEEREQDRRAPT